MLAISHATEAVPGDCDTVINNKKYYSSHFWPTAPKTLGISCDDRDKGVFCYVNEVTFRKATWMGAGCQRNHVISGLELSVPTPDFWGGERV